MPATPSNGPDTGDQRLRDSFLEEERLGLKRGLILRWIAMPIIAVYVVLENSYPEMLFFEASIALFLLAGCLPYWLDQRGQYRPWHRYLFPAIDILLLAVVNFVPNPLAEHPFSPQVLTRFRNEMYVFLIIAINAFTYEPRIVLWTGFFASVVWAIATGIVFWLPDSLGFISDAAREQMTPAELELALMHPKRVDIGFLARQALLFLLSAATSAAFVQRTRELVGNHARAERARSNLSRYFSANMVEELAQLDHPLGATRQQEVAVLFADIVGFTTLSEKLAPADLVALLRGFHGVVQHCVFENSGTLDKYLGDGVMATFGTPDVSPNDATNALRCTLDIERALKEWVATSGEPLRVSIGVHYGPVVIGDIGGDQRLEFAVLGDTVNVASRIEELTRDLGVADLVSRETIDAARAEKAPPDLLDCFRHCAERDLRGRTQTTALYTSTPPAG